MHFENVRFGTPPETFRDQTSSSENITSYREHTRIPFFFLFCFLIYPTKRQES